MLMIPGHSHHTAFSSYRGLSVHALLKFHLQFGVGVLQKCISLLVRPLPSLLSCETHFGTDKILKVAEFSSSAQSPNYFFLFFDFFFFFLLFSSGGSFHTILSGLLSPPVS